MIFMPHLERIAEQSTSLQSGSWCGRRGLRDAPLMDIGSRRQVRGHGRAHGGALIMDPYAYALQEAAHNLFHSLGTLDDLGPELADTVANVYYRYALATGTVSNLALALGTADGDELTAEIGVIIAQQEYVDDMVKAVRRAGHKPQTVARMKRLALDTLKYRISDVSRKSGLRRAIERWFANVREIAGLYEMMRMPLPAEEART
jgi:hypothetical protein